MPRTIGVGSAIDIKLILLTFSLINSVCNVYYNPQSNFYVIFYTYINYFMLFTSLFVKSVWIN